MKRQVSSTAIVSPCWYTGNPFNGRKHVITIDLRHLDPAEYGRQFVFVPVAAFGHHHHPAAAVFNQRYGFLRRSVRQTQKHQIASFSNDFRAAVYLRPLTLYKEAWRVFTAIA
jgi:hypothetical protein